MSKKERDGIKENWMNEKRGEKGKRVKIRKQTQRERWKEERYKIKIKAKY